MPPPDAPGNQREINDQLASQQSFEMPPRLARCAKQIDELYHKFDGCLEHIADIRAAKLFYEGKAAEMGERLRQKLDRLEEALMSDKETREKIDASFLEDNLQEELNNIRKKNQ